MTEHDIHDLIKSAQDDIERKYKRIQKRVRQDPGTAGDQGEENWAALLRAWLPSYFHIVTKGRILCDSGYASRQVDVLVLMPSYPPVLLEEKHYLAGGVAAAFECKLTLEAADVRKAVETCSNLRNNLPKPTGSPYKELNSNVIYGILAHSHSWKDPGSKPMENIEKALQEADQAYVTHPIQCMDFICVSDLAAWTSFKSTYIGPNINVWSPQLAATYGENGSAHSAYMRHAKGQERQEEFFSPIGTLLSRLYSKLAWTFPDMRKMDQYFRTVNIGGSGEGPMRLWSLEIYSEEVRRRVNSGLLNNGVFFDEWSFAF